MLRLISLEYLKVMEQEGTFLHALEDQRNATFMPLLLEEQTERVLTSPAGSPSIPEDLVKGIVIAVPILTALILAPTLLSYSKKRFLRKTGTTIFRKSSHIPTRWRRDGFKNSKTGETCLKEARVIEIPNGKSLRGGKTPSERQSGPRKSNLKRCKMFIESEFSSNSNSTRYKRIRIPKPERPVSVELGNGKFLGSQPAKSPSRKRHNSHLGIQNDLNSRSRPQSWVTVIQNMAYEDTIPSYSNSRLDIPSSPASCFNPKILISLHEKGTEVPHGVAVQDNNALGDLKKTSSQYSVQSHNGERTSLNEGKGDFCPKKLSKSLPRDSTKLCCRQRRNVKEQWLPLSLVSGDLETGGLCEKVDKSLRCQPTYLKQNRELIHLGKPDLKISGTTLVAISGNIADDLHVDKYSKRMKLPGNIIQNPNYECDRSFEEPVYLPKNFSQNNQSGSKSRRKKKKVRIKRRIRDERHRRLQQRLRKRDPVFTSGYNRSCCSGNNSQTSRYMVNYHGSLTDTSDEGDRGIGEQKLFHRHSQYTRMDESTLLEDIWKHLKMLVERSRSSEDSLKSSMDNGSSTDSQSTFSHNQATANQGSRRGCQNSNPQTRGESLIGIGDETNPKSLEDNKLDNGNRTSRLLALQPFRLGQRPSEKIFSLQEFNFNSGENTATHARTSLGVTSLTCSDDAIDSNKEGPEIDCTIIKSSACQIDDLDIVAIQGQRPPPDIRAKTSGNILPLRLNLSLRSLSTGIILRRSVVTLKYLDNGAIQGHDTPLDFVANKSKYKVIFRPDFPAANSDDESCHERKQNKSWQPQLQIAFLGEKVNVDYGSSPSRCLQRCSQYGSYIVVKVNDLLQIRLLDKKSRVILATTTSLMSSNHDVVKRGIIFSEEKERTVLGRARDSDQCYSEGIITLHVAWSLNDFNGIFNAKPNGAISYNQAVIHDVTLAENVPGFPVVMEISV